MSETTNRFEQDYEDVIKELSFLANLCNIQLSAPGVIDAVLRNEAHVRASNEVAFDKMRGLLILSFKMIEQGVSFMGAEPTTEAVARVLSEVAERYKNGAV